MDIMEKLVKILKQAPFEGKVLDEWWSEEKISRIVDYLIRKGVMAQEWISVNDRLRTEEAKAYEKEWCEKYPEFLVMIERGLLPTVLYYDWRENEWFRELGTYKVTHWMPLPAPPKGE